MSRSGRAPSSGAVVVLPAVALALERVDVDGVEVVARSGEQSRHVDEASTSLSVFTSSPREQVAGEGRVLVRQLADLLLALDEQLHARPHVGRRVPVMRSARSCSSDRVPDLLELADPRAGAAALRVGRVEQPQASAPRPRREHRVQREPPRRARRAAAKGCTGCERELQIRALPKIAFFANPPHCRGWPRPSPEPAAGSASVRGASLAASAWRRLASRRAHAVDSHVDARPLARRAGRAAASRPAELGRRLSATSRSAKYGTSTRCRICAGRDEST